MLGAQPLGDGVGLARRLGMEDELDEARAVAQVDEDQPAVVAAAVHPAGDAHGVAGARRRRAPGPGVAVVVRARRPHDRPPRDVVHDRVRLHCALLSGLHVLQRRALVAEDGNVAGAGPVGLLELALERAAAEFDLALRPGAARRRRRAGTPRPRAPAPRRRRTGRSGGAAAGASAGGQQDPLDAGRPADAGRRRPADLLDQPVVAAAAADAGLGAERVGGELEHGARVVVEAAHERRRRPRRRCPTRVEQRADRLEVLAVLVVEPVEQPRRAGHHLLRAAVVGVERAQRVEVDPRDDLLGAARASCARRYACSSSR